MAIDHVTAKNDEELSMFLMIKTFGILPKQDQT